MKKRPLRYPLKQETIRDLEQVCANLFTAYNHASAQVKNAEEKWSGTIIDLGEGRKAGADIYFAGRSYKRVPGLRQNFKNLSP